MATYLRRVRTAGCRWRCADLQSELELELLLEELESFDEPESFEELESEEDDVEEEEELDEPFFPWSFL